VKGWARKTSTVPRGSDLGLVSVVIWVCVIDNILCSSRRQVSISWLSELVKTSCA
jgi:hypothetical protein